MKKLILGTIAFFFVAVLSLSAQNHTSVAFDQSGISLNQNLNTENKDQLNNSNNLGAQNQKMNNQTKRNKYNEVCDGTQKRLHKKQNLQNCDNSGKKAGKRNRR